MKKVLFHISALTLMVYMLISSMGIFVYEHHCMKEGTFYGVSSEFNHNCDDEEVSEKLKTCSVAEKSCCKKPSNEKQATKNCCTTDLNWIQLDVDLSLNDVEVDFEKDLNLAIDSNFNLFLPQSKSKIDEIRGPPPKILKPSLSALQCYLI